MGNNIRSSRSRPGDEDQRLAGSSTLGSLKPDAPQKFGVILPPRFQGDARCRRCRSTRCRRSADHQRGSVLSSGRGRGLGRDDGGGGHDLCVGPTSPPIGDRRRRYRWVRTHSEIGIPRRQSEGRPGHPRFVTTRAKRCLGELSRRYAIFTCCSSGRLGAERVDPRNRVVRARRKDRLRARHLVGFPSRFVACHASGEGLARLGPGTASGSASRTDGDLAWVMSLGQRLHPGQSAPMATRQACPGHGVERRTGWRKLHGR